MSQPLISVIVPAYKRADTVERAVRSALAQTYRQLEVIVVDDDSRDGTSEAVAAIKDDRVHLLRHDRNRGGNAARRTAVHASRGEYIAFLDADDLWYPGKLAAQLTRLEEAGPDYAMVYSWYETLLPDGTVVPPRRTYQEGLTTPALLRSNFVGTFSTVMVTRAMYDEVGGPDPSMPACQDWEFYLRLNRFAGIACVPRTLVTYWRGDADANRISSSRARVAAGHAEVYRRIADRLNQLPTADAVAARRYLMEAVANHADTAQVLTMAIDTPRGQWTPGAARFVGHMLARSVRKGGLKRSIRVNPRRSGAASQCGAQFGPAGSTENQQPENQRTGQGEQRGREQPEHPPRQ